MHGETISYTIDIGANIEKVKRAMSEVSGILDSSNLDKNITAKYERKLGRLRDALVELETKAGLPFKSNSDVTSFENSLKTVDRLIGQLGADFKELLGKDLSKSFGDFTKPIRELKRYTEEVQKAIDSLDRFKERQEADRESYRKLISDKQRDITSARARRQEADRKEPARLTELKKLIEEADNRIRLLEDEARSSKNNKKAVLKIIDNEELQNLVKATKELDKFKEKYKDYIDKNGLMTKSKVPKEARSTVDLDPLKNEYKLLLANKLLAWEAVLSSSKAENIEDEIKKYQDALTKLNEINTKIGDVQRLIDDKKAEKASKEKLLKNSPVQEIDDEIAGLEKKKKELEDALAGIADTSIQSEQKIKTAFENLRNAFAKITGDKSFEGLEYTKENFEKIRKAAEDFSAGRTNLAIEQLRSLGIAFKDLGGSTAGIKDKIDPAFDALGRAKEASSDFDHLTYRLKYFFSLAGGFNLMRRAIRSAVTTTKELDAVMTLTAVVSLYSVSDMWKTLPQYSKEAQKLGVAIKDVYSAQTLYVQLGLDMNSAMQIGIETMKMARVANIGAEEATNSMTAALRGFNMELTERSAKRVNDVYSKLAQNTASNTQEISTAMTKTAALANSANMSFENTSAFLATIIESTREGAETAGTALKTVIARFTEVKKLYSKGELTGTDEEGQEVNVNKISTALRTAGINMNKFFTGALGLDEVFMELGKKWSNLSTVLQRYIATMAAGSRQQSRFLALMQNYNRTLELSNMAYNSAGSGLEQFDKTLESLEAKLARFKDAWATFVMGIANSDAIKGIVNTGTWILNTINNIIEKISGGNGLVKAVLSIGTAFATFKVGGALLKGTLGSLAKSFIFNKKLQTEIAGGFFGRMAYRKAQVKKNFLDVKLGFTEPLFSFWPWKRNGKQRRQTIIENEKIGTEAVAKAEDNLTAEEAKLEEEKKSKVGKKEKYRTEEQKRRAVKLQTTKVEGALTALTEALNNQKASTELAVGQLNAYASALGAVAIAAGVAAGALGLVANNLEEAGNKKASAAVSGIAAGLGALSVGAGIASSAVSAMGAAVAAGAMQASTAMAAIPFVGWALLAVTAITTVGVAIAKYHKTAKEKLEDSKKALEEQQAYFSSIKDKYSEVNEAVNKLTEQEDALKKMTKDTLEWDSAVKDLNENILEFVKNFPEFKDAIEFDTQTGRLTLNSKEVAEKLRKLKELVEAAQGGVTALEASTAYYDFNYKRSKLSRKNRLSDSEAKKLSSLLNGTEMGLYTSSDFDEWIEQAGDRNIGQEDAKKIQTVLESLRTNGFFYSTDAIYIGALDQLTSYANGGKPVDNANLKRILKRVSEFYQLAEMYGEYETKIESLGKLTGQTYIAENSRYNGIVNRVALEAGTDKYNEIMLKTLTDYEGTNKKEKKEDEDKWVELWLKSLGATDYNRTNGWNFSYKNAKGLLATGNYGTVKTLVLKFKLGQLAEKAQQKVIEDFWIEFADINHKLISGKGTYTEYNNGKVASAEGSAKKDLMSEFVAEFDEARNNLSKIMFGEENQELLPKSFGNLGLFLTTNIADLATTWQTKFGKELAKNFLTAIDSYLADTEDVSGAADNLIYVLSLVENGAISSLEEFTEELAKYGLENFKFNDIETFFKKPKGFEKAQENLKSGLSLWNTARTSTVFSQEDRDKLLASGMKREDFILTSLGYVSTKSSAATSGAVKGKMIEGVESEISALNTLIDSVKKFNKNLTIGFKKEDLEIIDNVFSKGNIEEYVKYGKNVFSSSGEKAVKGRLDEVRKVLGFLVGEEIYNPNTGGTINLSDIADEDLASYLQYYLDNTGNVQAWIGQRSALLTELGEIKNNKLLDLAPTILSAIIDIITEATSNGIDIGEAGIDLFVNFRKYFGSDKLYTNFLNSFSQLDWSEINNVEDFTKELKKLGIELNAASDDTIKLYDTIQGVYGQSVTNELRSGKAAGLISSAKEIIERIAGGNRKVSTEEYEKIRKFLGENFKEENWVKTNENEYTYIGETNALLSTINGNVATIAANIKEKAKEDYEKGKKVSDILEDKSNRTDEVLSAIIKGNLTPESLNAGYNGLTLSNVRDTAKALGIEGYDKLSTEDLFLAITDYINNYYGPNGEKFKTNGKIAEGGTTETYSLMSTDELLRILYSKDKTITDEDRDTARESFDARWAEADAGTQFAYERAMGGLSETERNSTEVQDAIKAVLLGADELNAKLTDTKTKLKDAVKELQNAGSDTRKWDAAMGKIKKLFKDTFNVDLTEKQIKDNIKLFQDWANGVKGAGEKVSKFLDGIFTENKVLTPEQIGDVDKIIDDALNSVDAEGHTVPITFEADEDSLTVVGDTAKAAMDAKAAAMGVKLQWVPDGSTPTPFGSLPNYKLVSAEATGGGGKKFKNDFDKYYNQVEDINELERQRNLLEKDYQQLLKSLSKSGVEIYNNLKKLLELLELQRKLVADLAEKRKGQLFDIMEDKEYKTVWKYAKWNDEDQTIEIDWDAINKIKKSKEGDLVKEYVKKLEEYLKMYDEQIEKLEDIEDTVMEIKDRGREEYQNLEDRTRDALIKQIQDKIDELTDVNEAINDTNQKLFDKISETLELLRQDRENKKTEEELSDKEKRLAYLRQDSSNANLVEIAQLEKELDEAREDYTDTLIDLKISELLRQNDEAAEQRDHLIELMEKSLDWLEKSGAFWNRVYALISLGTDETGSLIHSSELADILKSAEGWEGLSEIGKMQWLQELLGLVASGFAYLGMSRQIEDVGVQAGTEITFTNGRGETLTGTVADNGDVLVTGEDGTVSSYSNVFLDYMGNYTTDEKEGEVAHLVDEWKSDALYHWKEVMFRGRAVQRVQMGPHEWTAKSTKVARGLYKWTCTVCGHEEITSKRKATPETGTQAAADLVMATETGDINLEDEINAISRAQEEALAEEEEKKKKYKNAKGGLHTHTGPTWIDGSWSKPELILNARDTENFIELKDTLTALRSGGGFSLAGGENYYDIDILVDSLGSDYDVDRMIDRIKSRIVQDNAYRNVNTLSRLR